MDLEDTFIKVTFEYDPVAVTKIKRIPGSRFNRTVAEDPHWRIAIDIDLCHQMREQFGNDLVISPALRRWARMKKVENEQLTTLALTDSATLDILHEKLPALAEAIHLGPHGRHMSPAERKKALAGPGSFQAADTKFLATSSSPMNCNQPGLGKTLETIAAVFEGGTEVGPKLVVAPLTSLETVWDDHLRAWQDQPVLLAPPDRAGRQVAVQRALEMAQAGESFWLVINPAMIQYKNDFQRCDHHAADKRAKVGDMKICHLCQPKLTAMFPELFEIEWSTLVLDEFHKMGLGNPATLTYKAMCDVKSKKRIALSGTPMGGKAIKMFGVLSFLFPDEFTSKWRFADQWLEVTDTGYGKTIGDIKRGKEEDFYKMLSRYMIRRTKEECLPWLPAKQYVELYIPMLPAQKSQYDEFAAEAEIRIDEEQMTATSILAEYTRLKQFATAKQTILGRDKDGKVLVKPTIDSNKLSYVIDLLEERGIRPGEDAEGDEQVVIFSQFSQVVDMLCDHLEEKGYPAARITGGVGPKERTALQRDFQKEGGLRVMCMTTTAGGVAITLDRASTVIFLDETWNPDDQEQAEDRCHRGSRIHQVTIYYLRSKDTIEEYIETKVKNKKSINRDILDLRRQGLRAV